MFHTFLVTSTAKVLQLLLEPQHPELLDLNRDAWPTALAVAPRGGAREERGAGDSSRDAPGGGLFDL